MVVLTVCGCATLGPTWSASLRLAADPGTPATGTPYVTGASSRAPSTGSVIAGAAEVPGGAQRPGQLLDLTNWYLTLPTGSSGTPDTVPQPTLTGYSGDFFRLDAAHDGIVFTANAGGVTTAHSAYPRSELREMEGTSKASWSNTTGTHTLTLRQAVTALPTAKPELVTAQIHDAQSDVIEIRLQGDQLVAAYADGKRSFALDPAYVLGTPYDLSLVAADGRIDVYYNGRHAGGITQSGSDWYFKTGCYLQSNTAHGDAPDTVGQVVLYSLQVDHSA